MALTFKKKRKIIKIIWAAVSIFVIFSMLAWEVSLVFMK